MQIKQSRTYIPNSETLESLMHQAKYSPWPKSAQGQVRDNQEQPWCPAKTIQIT